jgi:hypothetical protein
MLPSSIAPFRSFIPLGSGLDGQSTVRTCISTTLRPAGFTLAALAGATIAEIMHRAGHSTPTTTHDVVLDGDHLGLADRECSRSGHRCRVAASRGSQRDATKSNKPAIPPAADSPASPLPRPPPPTPRRSAGPPPAPGPLPRSDTGRSMRMRSSTAVFMICRNNRYALAAVHAAPALGVDLAIEVSGHLPTVDTGPRRVDRRGVAQGFGESPGLPVSGTPELQRV